jgi:hypothetical protein
MIRVANIYTKMIEEYSREEFIKKYYLSDSDYEEGIVSSGSGSNYEEANIHDQNIVILDDSIEIACKYALELFEDKKDTEFVISVNDKKCYLRVSWVGVYFVNNAKEATVFKKVYTNFNSFSLSYKEKDDEKIINLNPYEKKKSTTFLDDQLSLSNEKKYLSVDTKLSKFILKSFQSLSLVRKSDIAPITNYELRFTNTGNDNGEFINNEVLHRIKDFIQQNISCVYNIEVDFDGESIKNSGNVLYNIKNNADYHISVFFDVADHYISSMFVEQLNKLNYIDADFGLTMIVERIFQN